jgi:hypothetical protein
LRERERERYEKAWGGVVRDTTVLGVIETKFALLKVPRQCPLVLLVELKLNYIEIYYVIICDNLCIDYMRY